MTMAIHTRPINERIDWLMEVSRKHSASFCSPDNYLSRQRYLAEHDTLIIAMKCMDGRIHLPYATQTPLGVIHPFREPGSVPPNPPGRRHHPEQHGQRPDSR